MSHDYRFSVQQNAIPNPHFAYPTPQTGSLASACYPDADRFPSISQSWIPDALRSGEDSGGPRSSSNLCRASGLTAEPAQAALHRRIADAQPDKSDGYAMPSPQLTPRITPAAGMTALDGKSKDTEVGEAASQVSVASGSKSLTPLPLDVPAVQHTGRSSPLSAVDDVESKLASQKAEIGLGVSGVPDLPGPDSPHRARGPSGPQQDVTFDSSQPNPSQRSHGSGAGENSQSTERSLASPSDTPLPSRAASLAAKTEIIDETEKSHASNLAQRHTKISPQASTAARTIPHQPRTVHIVRAGDPPSAVYAATIGQHFAAPPSRRNSLAPEAQRISPTMHVDYRQNTSQTLSAQHDTGQAATSTQLITQTVAGTPVVNQNRHNVIGRLGSINMTIAAPLDRATPVAATEENHIRTLHARLDQAKEQLKLYNSPEMQQYWSTVYLQHTEEIRHWRDRRAVHHPPAQVDHCGMPLPAILRQASAPHVPSPLSASHQPIEPGRAFPPAYPSIVPAMQAAVVQRQHMQQMQQQRHNALNPHNAGHRMQALPPAAFSLPVLPQNDFMPSYATKGSSLNSHATSTPYFKPLLQGQTFLPLRQPVHTAVAQLNAGQNDAPLESEADASLRSVENNAIDYSGYSGPQLAATLSVAPEQQSKFARAARLRKASAGASPPDKNDTTDSRDISPVSVKMKSRERGSSGNESVRRVTRSSPAAAKQAKAEEEGAVSGAQAESGKPVNKKRLNVELKEGDLVVESEWETNPIHFRRIHQNFVSHDFARSNFYWSLEEQAANRRLIRCYGSITAATGNLAIVTETIQPSRYKEIAKAPIDQLGCIISLHFKNGLDRSASSDPHRQSELYWITNHDVLKLSEYLLGFHMRNCHYTTSQQPRQRYIRQQLSRSFLLRLLRQSVPEAECVSKVHHCRKEQ